MESPYKVEGGEQNTAIAKSGETIRTAGETAPYSQDRVPVRDKLCKALHRFLQGTARKVDCLYRNV